MDSGYVCVSGMLEIAVGKMKKVILDGRVILIANLVETIMLLVASVLILEGTFQKASWTVTLLRVRIIRQDLMLLLAK